MPTIVRAERGIRTADASKARVRGDAMQPAGLDKPRGVVAAVSLGELSSQPVIVGRRKDSNRASQQDTSQACCKPR